MPKRTLFHHLTIFLELLFPRKALVRELEAMTPEQLLARCGDKLEQRVDFLFSRMVGAVRDAKPPEKALAILPYRDPLVKEAIWQIKYKKNEKVVQLLATILIRTLERYAPASAIVTSIPSSAHRQKERGYSQVELLLERVRDREKVRADASLEIDTNVLAKIRHTKPQSSLRREDRLKNLDGCFEVSAPKKVTGKVAIVVDDVITTGSTLAEASRALYHAGARSVWVIALAH